MSTMNMGEEGFWWFMGVVENRDDPKKLGRVQVRIHNIHSDKQTILPTENIPWAVPLMPITSASSGQVGTSPTGIKVGSAVFGFFLDGRSAQNPVIVGTFPGIPGNDVNKHDVASEAREVNKITKTPVGPEPASPYAAKYPYNKVTRTESGHVIEVDDTPGKSRLHVYHKSGTYIEVDEVGRLVIKGVDNRFDVTVKDNNMYVGGNINLTVKGNVTAAIDGNVTATIGGSVNATVGGSTMWKCPTNTIDGNLTVTGHATIQRGLSVTGSSGGAAASITGNMNVQGTIQSSGDMTAPAFHGVADQALDGLDN